MLRGLHSIRVYRVYVYIYIYIYIYIYTRYCVTFLWPRFLGYCVVCLIACSQTLSIIFYLAPTLYFLLCCHHTEDWDHGKDLWKRYTTLLQQEGWLSHPAFKPAGRKTKPNKTTHVDLMFVVFTFHFKNSSSSSGCSQTKQHHLYASVNEYNWEHFLTLSVV